MAGCLRKKRRKGKREKSCFNMSFQCPIQFPNAISNFLVISTLIMLIDEERANQRNTKNSNFCTSDVFLCFSSFSCQSM